VFGGVSFGQPDFGRKPKSTIMGSKAFLYAVLVAVIPVAHSDEPACRKPAELYGHFSAEVPNAIVMVKKGRNLNDMVLHLATKYHFVPYVYNKLQSFAAQKVTEELVAKLRCEAGVDSITWDGLTPGF
jgi:hypothetical protein